MTWHGSRKVWSPFSRGQGGAGWMSLVGVLLSANACGSDGRGPESSSSGGGPSSAGGSMEGPTGGALGVGGVAGGGSPAAGGRSPMGGGPGSGGTENTGGIAPIGGNDSGGATVGGSGGGGPSTGCTRDLLKKTLRDYLAALALRDPKTLPLAASLKFTENGEVLEIGKSGLWTTAGITKYSQSALDTELCTVAAQAVIPDGTTDIPVALRLKVEDAMIVEAEMIAARPGDYAAVASNTGAIIAIADSVGWEETLPEAERSTREVLIAWMDKYFRKFPQGVCNVTNECRRLENGGGNFPCGGLGATCAPGDPGPGDQNLPPRLILADVETGVGVGLTIYDGHTDMHMFKMRDGTVRSVQAVLSQADGMSGWD